MDAPTEIDHHPKCQTNERSKEGLSTPPHVSQQSMPTTMEKVSNDPAKPPIHPFAGVKDMAYSLPTTDNVTTKLKPLPPKKANEPLKTFVLEYPSKLYIS